MKDFLLSSHELNRCSDLTREALAVLRLQEAVVHLVGPGDHRGHGVLVARRDDGEQRQSGQGQVVHAAGHAALVVAVRVEAAGEREEERKRKQAALQ